MNLNSTSLDGLNEIIQSEGSRLNAYQDQVKRWTIGVGHTGKVDGVPVHSGMTISESKQRELFAQDIGHFENLINRNVKVPLSQNQFDALVSLSFNIGDGNFLSSTLLRELNKGNYAEAAEQFSRWKYSGGKINDGLINRRARERELFERGCVRGSNISNDENEPYNLNYKIKLKTPDGDKHFSCPSDSYILEQAEINKIELPYSCRAGSCSTCVAKLTSGKVDQSGQSFLDDEQIKAGYVCLCVAYPETDCEFQTNVEGELIS